MPKRRINVTKRDIKFGVGGSPLQCPLGRAVGRMASAHSRHTKALVGIDKVMFRKECATDYFGSSDLPWAAAKFRSDFDHDKPVKPFTFRLEMPV